MKPMLTDAASVEKVVQAMTLQEKARMVIGGSPFHTEAMPEYGIPAMYMLDSCNGVNSLEYAGENLYQSIAQQAEQVGQPLDREKNNYMGGLLIALGALQKKAIAQAESGEKPAPKPFGCYPPGIALGSTWNPEVIEECGSQLAKEMAHYGIDMILGPNVNIHRDPLCGRLGESFTEDPYLMSQLAPAMIRGIQKEGMSMGASNRNRVSPPPIQWKLYSGSLPGALPLKPPWAAVLCLWICRGFPVLSTPTNTAL